MTKTFWLTHSWTRCRDAKNC